MLQQEGTQGHVLLDTMDYQAPEAVPQDRFCCFIRLC